MPKWFSSFKVTRVSSAATKSACSKVSRARGEKSPKFPMGVPTTYRAPRSKVYSMCPPYGFRRRGLSR